MADQRKFTDNDLFALPAVSIGAAVGALARYSLVSALPVAPGGFPLVTLLVNSGGCLLIGILMVAVAEAHRRVRLFLGTGLLGGFTTFSAYSEEVRALLRFDAIPLALAYLVCTVVFALVAVAVGMKIGRRIA